ncbi:P-loop containing nucleoside triphosphate hydrolase protein [Mycena rebaudengoi]|nr:P-loop containing nucleoside triphosphate hydrolase protein [Mycena rebaudengoi]
MASSATLTTSNLPHFRSILEEWDAKKPAFKDFEVPVEKIQGSATSKDASKDVVVAFRTRPPLPNEASDKFHRDDIDLDAETDGDAPTVEFCSGISVTSAEPGTFVAHLPGMKWSGPTLTHKTYKADLAFSPHVENEEVYQRTVIANDILTLVLSGGVGCIMAYGQTASGKTYTMEGIEHRIARDLFKHARVVGARWLLAQGDAPHADANANNIEDVFEFNVTFVELLGNEPESLDAHGNPVRKEIPVREDKVGNLAARLISSPVRSSDELEALIIKALSHRRTTATRRNETSSRSHAMLKITIKNAFLPYADEGQLILVDLAGSERYEDSKGHDKQRMEEVKDNNKSLMNLKECVRAKARMALEDGFVHIPWRANKLTMLLKPIFDIESRQPSKAVIIAHVSPHIQDSVHSTNTLSYAAPFMTVVPRAVGPAPYDAEDPRTWDHDATIAWLTAQFTERTQEFRWIAAASKASAQEEIDLGVDINKICPAGSTAKNLGMLYTPQFVERCLEARTGALKPDELKLVATETIGCLFYLILVGKHNKRNEIMHTRKEVVGNSYGDIPRGASRPLPALVRRAKMIETVKLPNFCVHYQIPNDDKRTLEALNYIPGDAGIKSLSDEQWEAKNIPLADRDRILGYHDTFMKNMDFVIWLGQQNE